MGSPRTKALKAANEQKSAASQVVSELTRRVLPAQSTLSIGQESSDAFEKAAEDARSLLYYQSNISACSRKAPVIDQSDIDQGFRRLFKKDERSFILNAFAELSGAIGGLLWGLSFVGQSVQWATLLGAVFISILAVVLKFGKF